MTDLPEPLTPADCDLQGMSFMPLHVTRLRDSDLAAIEEPEACWYAVLLWCASWHQIPAASIPDDDAVLTRMVGLGRDVKTFRKHRDGALRGFVKCADGRFYHPVVADEAVKAWAGRTEHRTEKNANAERQARWRAEMSAMCEKLRNLGVTPPAGAKKETLRALLDEAERNASHNADRNASRNAHNVTTVTPVMAKTGTGTGTVPPTPVTGHAQRLRQVMEEGRFTSPPNDGSLIDEWIAAGADFERDVLPVVRTVSQRMLDAGRGPFKLKAFDAAIRERLAADQAEIDRFARSAERMRRDQAAQEEADAAQEAEDAAWRAQQQAGAR
jgi:hypothetical protein